MVGKLLRNQLLVGRAMVLTSSAAATNATTAALGYPVNNPIESGKYLGFIVEPLAAGGAVTTFTFSIWGHTAGGATTGQAGWEPIYQHPYYGTNNGASTAIAYFGITSNVTACSAAFSTTPGCIFGSVDLERAQNNSGVAFKDFRCNLFALSGTTASFSAVYIIGEKRRPVNPDGADLADTFITQTHRS